MSLDLLRREGPLPKLVAHRGASAVAPENTLAAFERAWQDGADLVELDLRLTADGHVVAMHDARVDRTTDGRGYVAEMTLGALRRLDAGAWFDKRYQGERVPTLWDVLEWAVGKAGLLLELKFDPFGTYDPALVEALLPVVADRQMKDRVAAISYQPRALAQLKAMDDDIAAGPIPRSGPALRLAAWLGLRFPPLARLAAIQRLLKRPLAVTKQWGCDVVAPNIQVVTPVLVEASHEAGFPVSCGGLHWDYPRAIAMGVDTIASNDPGVVRTRYLA